MTKQEDGRGLYIHWGVPGTLLILWLVSIVWMMASTSAAVEANTKFREAIGPRVYALESSDKQRDIQFANICSNLAEIKSELRAQREGR